MTPGGEFYLGKITPWRWPWKKEIKFQLYILIDSHRLGFVFKVTMLTIVLVYRSVKVIVQVLHAAAVQDSLPSPMKMYGSSHIVNIADTQKLL